MADSIKIGSDGRRAIDGGPRRYRRVYSVPRKNHHKILPTRAVRTPNQKRCRPVQSGDRSRCLFESLCLRRSQCTPSAAGEETEVPDADEATREFMQHETTQEFIDVKSQESTPQDSCAGGLNAPSSSRPRPVPW
jgi:hypothetical protein